MSRRPSNRFRESLLGSSGRPIAIAHRGDSFHAPENTLIAARLGHLAGADGWEFDVQLTTDGVPIVLHDPSLSRTTDVARVFPDDPRASADYPVAAFSIDEIRRLDAGSWFLDPSRGRRTSHGFGTFDRLPDDVLEAIRTRQIGIPTLEEALIATIERSWLANVEVKSGHDGDFRLVDSVMAVIGQLDAADRVLVSSFDHAEVARVAARMPEVATGVLSTTPLYRPAYYIREIVGADAYHISREAIGGASARYRLGQAANLLRLADVGECRRSGVPVLVYTVNEIGPKKMADHLAEAGVAGLITDDPSLLVATLTPS